VRRALAALVVCCSTGFAACNPSPPAISVLLVTLDTTRADHLGSYGAARARTPNLDALAAEGIRYEHAYSPAPITLPAHASLLTGLYPFEHRVRDNGDFPLSDRAQTLAEVLQRHGYRTGAVVAAFVLDRRFGLAQGFDSYDDVILEQRTSGSFGFAERQAPAVTDAALAWLSDQPPDRPYFLWVHYFDPHAGYEPHSNDSEFFGLPPYDAEISFADREIGRLLGRLSESGRDAETLVVTAADHGEGLWEHGEISHGYFVYDSTLRAALILRLPDRAHAGTAIAAPVSLVDVFPTVLERLGIPPCDVSGVALPLAEPDAGAALRSIYFENYAVAYSFGLSPLRGIVRGRDKWIEAPRPERYDLAFGRAARCVRAASR
jgi:arylsulfatase A-like enzyme